MKRTRILLFVVCTCWLQAVDAVQATTAIAYVYPAGGQQGSEYEIVIGGQGLRGPSAVIISGEGVHAEIDRFIKPFNNLNQEQRYILMGRMLEACMRQLKKKGRNDKQREAFKERLLKSWPWNILKKTKIKIDGEKLPDHPLFSNIEEKTIPEIIHLSYLLSFPRKKMQLNRQLAELVVVKLRIDADARVGNRTLRVLSKRGLSNPLVFQIGAVPEVTELEVNDITAHQLPPGQPMWRGVIDSVTHDLPVLINGCIMPGDNDRFRFRARKGQRLILHVSARELIPYLADAVPGWFQAVLTIYDAQGKEIAYNDDYKGSPDPVIFFRVPADGEYEVGIRDSIYRGRQDFIYRLSIDETPLLASDTFTYASGDIAEIPESVVLPRIAQALTLPVIVSGSISQKMEKDVYRIDGTAGQKIVAEIIARRIGSPVDSLLRIIDASGAVIAWNDDFYKKQGQLHIDEIGTLTHHADSYIMTTLPHTGVYYIQVSDLQQHAGDDYTYRLRVSEPRPDFSLRMTPSSIFARTGDNIPVCVYVLRRDGFAGAIDVTFTSITDENSAITFSGSGQIPAGSNSCWMTMRARGTGAASHGVIEIKVIGRSTVNGVTVQRRAQAADNVMQAFLYRHLLPTEQSVAVLKKGRSPIPKMSVVTSEPYLLQASTTVSVRLRSKKTFSVEGITLKLVNAPEALHIDETPRMDGNTVSFQLSLTEHGAIQNFSGNIIVEVSRVVIKGKKKKRRVYSLGFLPAIPIRIVAGSELGLLDEGK